MVGTDVSELDPSRAGEMARLVELRGYGILDTPNEPEFDRLVQRTAQLFGVPIALISFLDATRSWFKARYGLDSRDTPSAISFCTHAIKGNDVFVVPDAMQDERFAQNPLVTGHPHIRFYAGVPLTTSTGRRIGSLCIVDIVPRPEMSTFDKRRFEGLAKDVMTAVAERQERRAAAIR